MVLIGRAQNPPEFFTLENLETNRFMTVILKSDLTKKISRNIFGAE